MSQKRGLGRGLGALIPSAPAPAAAEEAPVEEATPEEATAERAGTPEAPGEESTTTPAKQAPARKAPAEATSIDETAQGEEGTTLTPPAGESPSRPSDMFFGSGTSAEESDDRPRRERPARDIAGEMAAAARSRKKKATSSPARGSASTPGDTAGSATEEAESEETRTREDAEIATGAAVTEDENSEHDGALMRGPRDWTPVRSETEVGDGAVHDEGAAFASLPNADDVTSEEDGVPGEAEATAPESELLPVPGAEFAEIPIDEIRVNPKNPRAAFDEDELDELAASIREVGVLQPIVVRPVRADDLGRSFEIVMGERRWRATQRSGLSRIPAIVRQTGDDDLLRDALIENLHRTQLNPLEEAAAYAQLLEDFDCTQDVLADRIGRSRPQISNTLRLMRLPGLVQKRVASGALSAGHARALLPLEDVDLMEELAQRIVSEGLSVRQTEALASRGQQPAARSAPKRSTYNPRVVDLTSQVSNRLQAPVRIDVGKRKGKMTVEFSNLDDLERIIDELGR